MPTAADYRSTGRAHTGPPCRGRGAYGPGTKRVHRLGALGASIAESCVSGRDDTAPSDGPSPIMSERALASLWQRVHTLALPVRLETRDGARFRVIYPGTANPLAGPDFCNAVVASDDGRVIRGDVELHLRAPDWYNHGHDSDPNYNGVILHVVLVSKGDSTSAQQSGLAVPIAEITPQGRADAPADAPCRSVEDMGGVLDRAGDERFFHRSRGYALEMLNADPDQVLYEALMEALGYSANRKPFRQLARRVPASLLAGLRGEPPATRRRAFEALLIQAAGMTSYVESDERAPEWRALSRLLPRLRPMSSSEWRLFRVRPANHPARRITGAAHLFNEHVERGLVSSIARMIREGSPASLIGGSWLPAP